MESEVTYRYVKIREASRITGIKAYTIRYSLNQGYIKGIKTGGKQWVVAVDSTGGLVYKGVTNA